MPLKTLTLRIGKKEIELTVDEAKELKETLNDLFGKEIVKEIIINERRVWDWGYPRPIYTDHTGDKFNAPYEITCKANMDEPKTDEHFKKYLKDI